MTHIRTFVVREAKNGVLLPIADLLARIDLAGVVFWRLRQITLGAGCNFGMHPQDIEEASWNENVPLDIPDHSFRQSLLPDCQIIDGVIEAWGGLDDLICFIKLDCQDATQWELSTDQSNVIVQLMNAGCEEAS